MTRLEYVCFTADNGYSVAARNYILALNPRYDIRIAPLDFKNSEIAGDNLSIFREMEKKPEDLNAIQIFHCIPPMQKRRKTIFRKSVGIATFETKDPPQHWVHILNKNKVVIAPSKFNEEIFKNAGVTVPIVYVPHCVDPLLFHPNVKPMFESNNFVFMYLGAWKERKGYKELVRAYLEEFENHEPVELFIHTNVPNQAEQYVRQIRSETGSCSKITINRMKLQDTQMPSLMRSASCLVCPTKGEGFGLPPLQAMFMKIPVICTKYSGCCDYISENTAFPLHPEGFVKCHMMDNIPQFAGKSWAYLSVSQIKKALRVSFGHTEDAQLKACNAYAYVTQEFSPEVILSKFEKVADRF